MAVRSLLMSKRLWKQPSFASSGFTLVELLLVGVIGSLVLLGAAFFAVSGIRTTAGQAIAQRYQMGFGRLSHLLETEVSEATVISYGVAVPGNCTGGGSSVFTLAVPVLARDEAASAPGLATIHYYQNGNDLWRCGPAVNGDGTLNLNTITSGVLLTNAQLFTQNATPSEFEYRVRMTDVRNATAIFDSSVNPGWLRARTRSFQITS